MSSVSFSINNFNVLVDLPQRATSPSDEFPKNFGTVMTNLFRGGWPSIEEMRTMQSHLGLINLVTLHSEYGNEPMKLAKLNQEIPDGINHHVGIVLEAQSFIDVAQMIIGLDGPTYVHCSAGANRTGKVILVAQVLLENKRGITPDQARLQNYLSQMLVYGFDFDKPYKHVVEEVLEILLSQGKIQLSSQQ